MRKRNSACCMLLGLVIAVPFAFAEEQASISRLPPLPQPLDPILQDIFDKRRAMGGAVINLSLTTGHAPKFARASGANGICDCAATVTNRLRKSRIGGARRSSMTGSAPCSATSNKWQMAATSTTQRSLTSVDSSRPSRLSRSAMRLAVTTALAS